MNRLGVWGQPLSDSAMVDLEPLTPLHAIRQNDGDISEFEGSCHTRLFVKHAMRGKYCQDPLPDNPGYGSDLLACSLQNKSQEELVDGTT